MRRRIALLLAAVTTTVLAVAVQTAPAASARTPNQPGWDHFHTVGPGGSTPVSLTWIKNNIPGYTVTPRRATGYGKEVMGDFTKGCPECTWYREDRNLTNHQPTSPNAHMTAARRGGFCWPWDSWPFGGCSGWNTPSTWNWAGIWNDVQPDPLNNDQWVNSLNLCWTGEYKSGFTFGLVGRQAIGVVMSKEGLIRISPEGFWYTVIGGCAWQFFR